MPNILCTKEALFGRDGTRRSYSVCCFSCSSHPAIPAHLPPTFFVITYHYRPRYFLGACFHPVYASHWPLTWRSWLFPSCSWGQ